MQALFSAVPDPPQISEVPKRRRGRPRGAPNRKRETITAKQYERLTIPMQIKQAFAPGARVAGLTGLLVGGLVPIATWGVVHFEVQENVWLWFLAGGGLLYSMITSFRWAAAAFGGAFKALGFCILLEGILAFAQHLTLSLLALGMLIFIIATSAACSMQIRQQRVGRGTDRADE